MADSPNPLLPGEPPAIPGPEPLDDAAVDRMVVTHQQFLDSLSEHDPNGLFFRRPDLAERARADAEHSFQAMLARAGVAERAQETPQERAQRETAAEWSFATIPEALSADLDTRIEAAKALTKEQRETAVDAMIQDLGSKEYAHLYDMGRPPTMPKQEFELAAGAAAYNELVKLAAVARPNLPAYAFSDPYVLRQLAGYGKAQAAMAIHRKV